jgi:PAS domain S-box-containing protein
MNIAASKTDKTWFIISLSIFLMGLSYIFLNHFFYQYEDHAKEILVWIVLLAGLFIIGILTLYIFQFESIKRISFEKDQALSLLEKRLAAIEAAGDGIGIVDPDGNLVYLNTALKNLHDIHDNDLPELIGQPWVNLYSENSRMELEDYILPELYELGYWRGNSPIIRRTGEVIDTELSLTLLPDGSMIGTARDISDHKKVNKEKEALEQQFYQAQKMEAIGRLAGGIAHDFNNILAAMSGYAEFLIEDLPEGSSSQKFAQNILKAGLQAKTLVNQMLAFSRQKQGTKDSMDLREPILESISMLKASLPRTIDITPLIQEDQAFIDGNPTQIAQVIMNLCVNAGDAMEKDHGQLILELQKFRPNSLNVKPGFLLKNLPEASQTPSLFMEEKSGIHAVLYLGGLVEGVDYYLVRVADAGTGMSKAIMEQMFEPFFTTKPVDKGTGLGLATVHGVISSHSGAMIVDSELGRGTSFSLYFPATSLKPVSSPEDVAKRIAHEKAHILLVEDQDEVREMTEKMLERSGYSVESCVSGLAALTILKERSDDFDLVLTDHNMPKMTGLEMIYQASLIDENMSFILLSGYSQESLQEMMNEHPSIKAVIRKPVARKTLEDKIASVLAEEELKAA